MTTATAPGVIQTEGEVLKRNEDEAWDLMLAALEPDAQLQAQLLKRHLPTAENQHKAAGWEFYVLDDTDRNGCFVCFVADTAADDPPFPRVNQRFMPGGI